MATVLLPSLLATQAGGRKRFEVDGATVDAVLRSLPVADLIFDESGALRPLVNVYVDGIDVRERDGLRTPLSAQQTVRVVAAVAGGNRELPAHVALAVVLQVRDGVLQALLWQRAREPFSGSWALPGGYLEPGETLEESIRRHLAAKVDVRELAHLEQLDTRSDPQRVSGEWQLATTYLGLVPTDADPHLPEDTAWHPVDRLPPTAFDHGEIVLAGRERLRAKLSYTNVGFALAPETFSISELRTLYAAALGHEVSATNLQRVLVRRNVLEPTGSTRPPGRSGGRPAALFRFRQRKLAVTDEFAVLRPPS